MNILRITHVTLVSHMCHFHITRVTLSGISRDIRVYARFTASHASLQHDTLCVVYHGISGYIAGSVGLPPRRSVHSETKWVIVGVKSCHIRAKMGHCGVKSGHIRAKLGHCGVKLCHMIVELCYL